MTSDRANRAPEFISRGRVEALSDGVFAIVVTLLVLEITVPHVAEHDSMAELARALWTLAPKFVSWVISSVTVCVIWLKHHRLLAMVSHSGVRGCCRAGPLKAFAISCTGSRSQELTPRNCRTAYVGEPSCFCSNQDRPTGSPRVRVRPMSTVRDERDERQICVDRMIEEFRKAQSWRVARSTAVTLA
jgi:hypothetical protein